MDVEETRLPGIGLRYDLQMRNGGRVGVVAHRTGRRDLLLFDPDDPDTCARQLPLTSEEADALAELLGAPRIVEHLTDLHREVEGLVSERVEVPGGSPYVGRTLADTQARRRTGASVVAVLRDGKLLASPRPDFRFEADDDLVVVGTREGVDAVTALMRTG